MIIYDANHPNRTGRVGEGRPLGAYTITTLDDGSVTLLGGNSTRPDPETLDKYRPPQKDFKGESIGNISSQTEKGFSKKTPRVTPFDFRLLFGYFCAYGSVR